MFVRKDPKLEQLSKDLSQNSGLFGLFKYWAFIEMYRIATATDPAVLDDAITGPNLLGGKNLSEAISAGFFDNATGNLVQAHIGNVDDRINQYFKNFALTDQQRIVLGALADSLYSYLKVPIGKELPKFLASQINSSHSFDFATVMKLVYDESEDFPNILKTPEKPDQSIFIGNTYSFDPAFVRYLASEIRRMENGLRAHNILSITKSVKKTADDNFITARKFFARMCQIAENYQVDQHHTYNYILNKVKIENPLTSEKLADLLHAAEAYQAILKANTQANKTQDDAENEITEDDILEIIRKIKDKDLRHQILISVYEVYHNEGPDNLFNASIFLAQAIDSPSNSKMDSTLKFAARSVVDEMDDLFLNPKFPERDLIVKTLNTTTDTINKPSFDNFNKLMEVSKEIGKYPFGKIAARSLIVLGGLTLIALGVGMAVGCPPLGLVAAAMGGAIIAGAVFGGVGLLTGIFGLYQVKKAAVKQSAAVNTVIEAIPEDRKKPPLR